MPSASHFVFVYGTLKKNEPNHYVMTSTPGFISNGETLTKYPLVIASKFNIPYLLDKAGTGHVIKGEVYEVNDDMLKVLDDFEGHPEYYQRREEPIKLHSSHETKLCWTYFLPKFKSEMLQLDHLSDYKSNGEHGKPYIMDDDIEDVNDI